jgi:Rod binding domain-containing protein
MEASGIAPSAPPVSPADRGWKTAQGLEANFFRTMLGVMFEGIGKEGPLGGSASSDAWRGMLVDSYADSIAANGGIGLAAQIYRDMMRNPE